MDHDDAGYIKNCDLMLDRFESSNDIHILERTAKTCLLSGTDASIIARASAMAERVKPQDPHHSAHAYFEYAKALAKFRSGEYQASIDQIQEHVGPGRVNSKIAAASQLVVAMAYHQLGQYGQANEVLRTTIEFIKLIEDTYSLRNPKALNPDALAMELLLQEAEALIEQDQ